MLYKKVSLGESTMIDDPSLFPVGTQFSFGGRIGIIKGIAIADSAQMRRIVYDDGTDEYVTLQTLIKDSESIGFKLIKDGENAGNA